jgi:hypothetical protein
VFREHPPGLRESHGAPDPLDHGHPEALLESLELLADGWLAVAERDCGGGDRAVLGERANDAQRVGVEVGWGDAGHL